MQHNEKNQANKCSFHTYIQKSNPLVMTIVLLEAGMFKIIVIPSPFQMASLLNDQQEAGTKLCIAKSTVLAFF